MALTVRKVAIAFKLAGHSHISETCPICGCDIVLDNPAYETLYELLLSSLSYLQFRAHNLLICKVDGWTTSKEVATELDIKINHASNLLKSLVDHGIAERRPGQKGYEYRVSL